MSWHTHTADSQPAVTVKSDFMCLGAHSGINALFFFFFVKSLCFMHDFSFLCWLEESPAERMEHNALFLSLIPSHRHGVYLISITSVPLAHFIVQMGVILRGEAVSGEIWLFCLCIIHNPQLLNLRPIVAAHGWRYSHAEIKLHGGHGWDKGTGWWEHTDALVRYDECVLLSQELFHEVGFINYAQY